MNCYFDEARKLSFNCYLFVYRNKISNMYRYLDDQIRWTLAMRAPHVPRDPRVFYQIDRGFGATERRGGRKGGDNGEEGGGGGGGGEGVD